MLLRIVLAADIGNNLNQDQYQNYFSKYNSNTSNCWSMLTMTSKCYLHIIFTLTVVNFKKKKKKKTRELEINKKKSRKSFGKQEQKRWYQHMKDTRHETPRARKAREYVRYESTQSTRHMRHEACEVQEHARQEACEI